MTTSMECHCLRLSEIPRTTRLFSSFMQDFRRVARFYAHSPDEAGVLAAAKEVKLDGRTRQVVVDILREQCRRFGANAETERNLARLESGAVTVVTGQQVGLFTGPAYSFYKALTAIRWARHLTAQGVDAVPVFWLATEDHDLAEVNHVYWGRRGASVRLELPESIDIAGRSVGEIRFGEVVGEIVAKAVDALEGPSREEVARALRQSCAPEETYGSSFGKLMARILSKQGIILLDPLDAGLHRLAATVYRRAIVDGQALNADLLARNKELEKAGLHAQVKVTQQGTLLFLKVEGRRQPLHRRNGGFTAGDQKFGTAELLDLVDKSPELFTPNVLLRPIVQDTLLPTAAYVGGAAEIAYYAQGEVIYRRMLSRMPAILPRSGFTLIEPRVARLLKKYDLELRDILRGRQHLRMRMERKSLPRGIAQMFDRDEKALRRLLSGLGKPLGKLDKTLAGAFGTAERKILYQFLKLRGKAGRAENLRSGILDQHERLLLDSIGPQHGLQERSLCLLPFLASQGLELLHELEKRISPGETDHKQLFL